MIDLRKGDCLELLKEIKDESVDVSFTSPPYNSVRHKKYQNYTDDLNDYYLFLCKFTDELLRVTKDTVIINVQSNYYNRSDVYKYIGKYNKEISRIIIWNKSNPTPSSLRHRLTNAYEFFLIFSKKNSVTINSIFMKDVIDYPINSTKIKGHSAVMNIDVCELFIKEFTKEKDTVLDCFMGSGTTGVVCKKYNRDFIGIELDESYFEIAKERINETDNEFTIFDYIKEGNQ
jgi:DNA modification methylase